MKSNHSVFLFLAIVFVAGSCCYAAETMSIEKVTVLLTVPQNRIPLWPVWSNDGKRIGFTSTDPTAMQGGEWLSQIWAFTVKSPSDARMLLNENQGATCACLSYAPDDAWLLYMNNSVLAESDMPMLCNSTTPGTKEALGLVASHLDPNPGCAILHSDIQSTPRGYKLVLDLEKGMYTSVYLVSLDSSGNPVFSTLREIVDDVAGLSGARLALSPSGNELLFAHWYNSDKPNIALITGLDRIADGLSTPIRSWSDSRVKIMSDGPNHADAPSWSADGSMFFYGYDFSGRFRMRSMNVTEADFDVMAARLEDVLAGNLTPTRLPIPGSQGCIRASKGGSRIVFSSHTGGVSQICAAVLRMGDNLQLDGNGAVQSDFALADGSGTSLEVGTSTEVANVDAGASSVNVSMFTPVAGLDRSQLPSGMAEMPVVRVLEVSGGSAEPVVFNPPATLNIAYGEGEVRGLDEDSLAVYAYNASTGRCDTLLPITAIDAVNNTITVPVPVIATANGAKSGGILGEGTVMVGVADSDGDGMADGKELRWDGDLTPNVYDPVTNPTGTDLNPQSTDTDNDGVTDSDEIRYGSDPVNPEDAATIPASDSAGLGLLMVLVGISAVVTFRAVRNG